MAAYLDKYTADTLNGKNVGVIFGKVHEGVALTGDTVAGTNKDFVFTPATYGPFYPYVSMTKTMVSTKSDVAVYDDGVAATISTWDATLGKATLSAAPAKDSVVTGDCVEQLELYIATDFKLDSKQEDDKLEQLRNSVTRHSYGNIEFTLKANFKLTDVEVLKFLFEPVSGSAGKYVFPSVPPTVYAMIPIERTSAGSTTIDSIIYCSDCRAQFGDILDAKAGKDALKNSIELSFGTAPILVDVSETS